MADEKWMPLTEHLEELRYRLLAAGIPWLLLVGVAFTQAGVLLDLIQPPKGTLVILAPAEGFLTHLRIAVYVGTAAAVPFFAYHALAFVMPGLEPGERRLLMTLVPVAVVLFAAGVAFGFAAVLPFALRFFLGFAGEGLEPMISVGRYVSFVAGVTLPFGLVFQLPVVIYALARVGLITGDGLRRNRRYAVLAILTVAAVLTPPDVVSQILMAIPMYGLYEVSIWVAAAAGRVRRRASP